MAATAISSMISHHELPERTQGGDLAGGQSHVAMTVYRLQERWKRPIAPDRRRITLAMMSSIVEISANIEEVVSHLQRFQMRETALEIRELVDDAREDPDCDDVDFESLQRSLVFLMNHPEVPHPSMGLRRGGVVDFAWQVPPDGSASLSFDADGSMTFATNIPGEDQNDRQRISGTTTYANVVACVIGNLLPDENAE